MGTVFERESELLAPVTRHLRRAGVRYLTDEMQFFDYRLDLFGYSSRTDSTHAVELKLYKWRRALEQAAIYQMCADYVSIALPLDKVTSVDLELLGVAGVGLIGVQSEKRCFRVLPPQRSKRVRPNYRRFYIDLLRGGH